MKIERYKVYAVLFAILSYVLWLPVYLIYEERNNVSNVEITILSWLGIMIICGYILYWKKIAGKYFTLFNVFLAFFVVFNFGQCFLWAIGIHTEKEIGQRLVYSRIAADNNLISRAQLIFFIAFVAINTGAICIWSKQKQKEIALPKAECIKVDIRYKCLYYTSLIVSLISVPVSIYKALYRFILSQRYSYRSLYYGEAAQLINNTFVNIVSSLFFVSLLGLLIGSGYKKNVRVVVYIIFAIFAVITLLTGDRGEWIYLFIFFFWADYYYYKKISAKKIFFLIVIGIFGLSIMNAIVALRNVGLSWDGFIDNLLLKDNNPFISLLTEFGHSMGIVIILLDTGVKSWYGNTYVMSFLTVFGTSIANSMFGTNYVQLHTWFPMDFLKISYGTDFSIIGEAVLNAGVYGMPLVLLVEGIIIGWISQLPNKKNSSPLALCLSISVMATIIKIARSTLWLVLNNVCYIIILFSLCYLLVYSFLKRKRY